MDDDKADEFDEVVEKEDGEEFSERLLKLDELKLIAIFEVFTSLFVELRDELPDMF
jgi:hypothetical protein